mmetsp:Transcript_14366/g.42904  ORF Transcript_14366/g.42904 Transcript_14366/m.42904 type:complete len:268 (-) Transcript_14366:24-827(-)
MMCAPMSLDMPKPETLSFLKTARRASSQRISFLLAGFWRSCALMYFQRSLMSRKWFARLTPATTAISGDSRGCRGSSSSSASSGFLPASATAVLRASRSATRPLNQALWSPLRSTDSSSSMRLRSDFVDTASRSTVASMSSSLAATRLRMAPVSASTPAVWSSGGGSAARASSAWRAAFASFLALRAAAFCALPSDCAVSIEAFMARRIDILAGGVPLGALRSYRLSEWYSGGGAPRRLALSRYCKILSCAEAEASQRVQVVAQGGL